MNNIVAYLTTPDHDCMRLDFVMLAVIVLIILIAIIIVTFRISNYFETKRREENQMEKDVIRCNSIQNSLSEISCLLKNIEKRLDKIDETKNQNVEGDNETSEQTVSRRRGTINEDKGRTPLKKGCLSVIFVVFIIAISFYCNTIYKII